MNTPAKQAKATGLKSLSQVSEMTGISLQTLSVWHKSRPKLYAIILRGCIEILKQEKNTHVRT